jgi:hypothetical protein
MLHVVFTDDGVPAWIGPEPREGSEPVDHDLMFLAAHRRTKGGKWVRRDPPPLPTPEELAAMQAQQAAAEAEVRAMEEENERQTILKLLQRMDVRMLEQIIEAKYAVQRNALGANIEKGRT